MTKNETPESPATWKPSHLMRATEFARDTIGYLSARFAGLRASGTAEEPIRRSLVIQLPADEIADSKDGPWLRNRFGELVDFFAMDIKLKRGSPHRWNRPMLHPVPEGFAPWSMDGFDGYLTAPETASGHSVSMLVQFAVSGDMRTLWVCFSCDVT